MTVRIGNADLMRARLDLMDRLVITETGDPDTYQRIRHYQRELQRWFSQCPDWKLLIFRGVARLQKVPATAWPGGGLAAFKSPRDYTCLVLALWFYKAAAVREVQAAAAGEKFLLSTLAEAVSRQIAGPGGEPLVDFTRYTDRQSMARALRFLEESGALQAINGETEDWVAERGEADVLYAFTEVAEWLALSAVQGALDLAEATEPSPLREPVLLPQVPPLQRAWRALLLGPALYRLDDPEAFAVLVEHEERIGQQLYDALGWQIDRRRDYAGVIRPDMPLYSRSGLLDFRGVEGDVVRLACTVLRAEAAAGRRMPDEHGGFTLTGSQWQVLLLDLWQAHSHHWGKGMAERSAEEYLRLVTAQMRRYGFLRGPDPDGDFYITPLAARVEGAYTDLPVAAEPPESRRRGRSAEQHDGQSRIF